MSSTSGPPTAFKFSTVMAIPGPQGIPGNNGTNGTNGTNGNAGTNAFTTTSGSFTMPAAGGSTSPAVTVGNTDWIGIGALLFIENAGVMKATAKTSTTVTLQNPSPAPAGNATPGTTIPTNSLVTAGGAAGAPGPAGPAPPGIGPIVSQTSATPIALSANEGQAAVMTGGIPAAAGVRLIFNVKSYGAVGDGVHDDGAAIQAAENARAAFVGSDPGNNPGGVLYFPTGIYQTSQELYVQSVGAVWEGDGPLCTSIRAAASMRSVLAVKFGPFKCKSMRFIGNGQADYCVLRAGDGQSIYDHVYVTEGKLDGFSSIQWQLPGFTAGTATQTGTDPLISVSSQNSCVLATSVATLKVKITTSGPNDGTAKYVVSIDGGATYGNVPQGVYPQSATGVPNASPSTVIGSDLGFRITFPNGSYTSGNVFTVPITYSGPAKTINDLVMFLGCRADTCGQWYHTSGADPSSGVANTLAAGTITTASGSQLIVGSGTSFLSMRARTGDFIYCYGTNAWAQILCVLDDTHIVTGYNTSLGNFSGQDFVVAVGSGYYDAVQGDGATQNLINCQFGDNCPQGAVFLGVIGNVSQSCQFDGVSGVGLTIAADAGEAVPNTVHIRPYFEAIDVRARAVFNASTNGVAIIEPTNYDRMGPGSELTILGGAIAGTGKLNHQSIQYEGQSFSVGSDGLFVPTVTPGIFGSNQTFVGMNPTGDHTLGGLTAPTDNGLQRILYNISNTYNIALVDNLHSGTSNLKLNAPYVNLGPYSTIRFISNGGLWYQDGEPSQVWSSVAFTPMCQGKGERIVHTTDNTLTNAYPLYMQAGNTAILGVSADISAVTDSATVGGFWEDVRMRFVNGSPVGSLTIGHATGTDAGGVPPAAWGGISIAAVGGVYWVKVQGAASTNITWRIRVRFF